MIGWYVHHHGWGHVTRLLAVRPHLLDQVTVFSSMPRPSALPLETRWIPLPSDSDPVARPGGAYLDAAQLGDVTAGGSLHWAPVGHPGHRARLALIADWVARHPVSAFVVDVSVEVTVFARLLGVPTVVFAQPGERTDAAHRLGYDLADRIIAPWAPDTIEAVALRSREHRLHRVGGISRYDGRARADEPDPRRVLFLGRTLDPARLRTATGLLQADGWRVDTAGTRDDDRTDDVWPILCRAAVVVSAAGQNAVADLAASRARAVVIAQERPFGEQEHTARVLSARGLADTAGDDVTPEELVRLIEHAAGRSPRWSDWQVDGAASRAAAAITEAAA